MQLNVQAVSSNYSNYSGDYSNYQTDSAATSSIFTDAAYSNTYGLTEIDTDSIGQQTYYKANYDGTYTIYTRAASYGAEPQETETLTKEDFCVKYPQAVYLC